MIDILVKRHPFPKSRRIRNRSDFARIYRLQQKAGDRHLLILAAPSDRDYPRIGLSVSRKHGNAVTRNRIKRLLREAFRLSQHDLPAGLDFILIPRRNSGAEFHDYRRSLVRLTEKLARRLKTQQED